MRRGDEARGKRSAALKRRPTLSDPPPPHLSGCDLSLRGKWADPLRPATVSGRLGGGASRNQRDGIKVDQTGLIISLVPRRLRSRNPGPPHPFSAPPGPWQAGRSNNSLHPRRRARRRWTRRPHRCAASGKKAHNTSSDSTARSLRTSGRRGVCPTFGYVVHVQKGFGHGSDRKS